MRKRTDGSVEIVHALHHARAVFEFVYEHALRLFPVFFSDEVNFFALVCKTFGCRIHVAVCVARKRDRLRPALNVRTDALAKDGRAKDRSV